MRALENILTFLYVVLLIVLITGLLYWVMGGKR